MKPRYADYIVEAHALRDAGRCEVDMRGVYLGVVCGMFTAPLIGKRDACQRDFETFGEKQENHAGCMVSVDMA